MKIKEVKCKSCMTKSKITDYVINPYTGCQHACAYCYADFIKKFQNIQEEWGKFVHVKVNCPELLKEELQKCKPGHIWLSSVCDCYMPLESKFKLTRKILQTIDKSPYKKNFTLEILTKSSLVKRDFDLIKKLGAELGMSINNLDEKTAKIIEPFASPPKERIETLKAAKEKGIKVFGFISPVLPGITNLEELFKELKFCNYVWVELLNTKTSVLDKLIPIIEKNFPDKVKEFERAINYPEPYTKEIRELAKDLGRKYKLEIKGVVVHNE
jgi:DNA repair photolyase